VVVLQPLMLWLLLLLFPCLLHLKAVQVLPVLLYQCLHLLHWRDLQRSYCLQG
jgi:hypothetical protein